MENKTISGQWHDFCHCVESHDVIFYYVGYFSQNIIAAMAEAVKMRVEYVGAAGLTRRKLFSSFIEMAQNVVHYSADFYEKAEQAEGAMRHGSVCISGSGERYYLYCVNPVQAEVAGRLREKLEHLRTLTIDEIKSEYKVMLRAETPEESKGAGLGLLTMARDASEPLEFEFMPSSADGTVMFYLKATI
ncbi:SiaB family protein kinase [Undibacterium sp. TJN25]|uniref:SiaB family protein kinase n=1 Tax=Undibacterium sp. TJN25 TaxID=3413056 RepID=UPI003BF18C07